MKVIKRDGRAVEYNREKIKIAIEKANHDVNEKERITEKQDGSTEEKKLESKKE